MRRQRIRSIRYHRMSLRFTLGRSRDPVHWTAPLTTRPIFGRVARETHAVRFLGALMARMPKYEKIRNRYAGRSRPQPTHSRFWIVANSSIFLWFLTATVLTAGGTFVSSYQQCKKDAEDQIEPIFKTWKRACATKDSCEGNCLEQCNCRRHAHQTKPTIYIFSRIQWIPHSPPL